MSNTHETCHSNAHMDILTFVDSLVQGNGSLRLFRVLTLCYSILPGNVAESVVLEREAESTLTFAEGANRAYAGHMTLKFSPDATSTMQHHKHYCLEVSDNCSPTVDHCIIRSASVGALDEAMMQALEHDSYNFLLRHDIGSSKDVPQAQKAF
ncbi:unnamed protein product [Pieris macdunnoughi]|uniref:Uncharacterized protein n=1 Tax=Pieris macdunnoughi TaxID=345717 RepID=A0A821MDJ8_9NEOP|nr:unnamed protein product [Pieris macdunnoughi]